MRTGTGTGMEARTEMGTGTTIKGTRIGLGRARTEMGTGTTIKGTRI